MQIREVPTSVTPPDGETRRVVELDPGEGVEVRVAGSDARVHLHRVKAEGRSPFEGAFLQLHMACPYHEQAETTEGGGAVWSEIRDPSHVCGILETGMLREDPWGREPGKEISLDD